MLIIAKTSYDEIKAMQEYLGRIGANIPKATAMTLTWMGQAAKEKVKKQIPHIFDRPTPWTQNSIYLKSANMTRLEAEVYIKDGSVNSLVHHIEGGKRSPMWFERHLRRKGILKGSNQFVVPAKRMKLDRYGNVGMGVMNKVLSALGGQLDAPQNSLRLAKKIFVVGRDGSGGLRAGIYELKGSGESRQLQPMFIFVKRTVYSRRFPFFEISEDAAYDAMDDSIDRAINRIIR